MVVALVVVCVKVFKRFVWIINVCVNLSVVVKFVATMVVVFCVVFVLVFKRTVWTINVYVNLSVWVKSVVLMDVGFCVVFVLWWCFSVWTLFVKWVVQLSVLVRIVVRMVVVEPIK